MSDKYNILFSPYKIGKTTVKNRAVMTAMMLGFSGHDGQANDRIIRFYEERARGGVGMIITEGGVVDEEYGRVRYNQMSYTLKAINSLERLALTVHKYDTRILAQLWHGGNICSPKVIGKQTVSASDVPAIPGNIPRPLTVKEIKTIIQKYAESALVCKQAGWDGVEVHAAHGYLLSQFLSPYFNHREDEYGGSFENRVRLLDEILTEVRAKVGRDFLISVRISADEMEDRQKRQHMTLEDGVKLAEHLDSLGLIDILNISNGNKFTNNANCDPYYYEHGWKEPIIRKVREKITVPTIATDTIKTPEEAEQMLKSGISEFAGIARGHLADPEFMRKAYEGREKEIRKCIGCLYCREARGQGQCSAGCAVNPLAGNEIWLRDLRKDGNGRQVVVIGGGPAGMEAALTFAKRGFRVKLLEQRSRLGGSLNLAAKPRYKEKIYRLIETMETQIRKAGVEVELGCEASFEYVSSLEPCAVVMAAGAVPVRPPIPGLEMPHVYTAEEIIEKDMRLKGRAAVVGSGMTGLETAELLADGGADVCMIEMQDSIGPGLLPEILDGIADRLTKLGVRFYPKHKLIKVTEHSLEIMNMDTGGQMSLDVDHVVLALGVAQKYKEKFGPNIITVGDAVKGGRIAQATRDGYTKTCDFEPYETD